MLSTVALAVVFSATVWGQAAAQGPQWKDRGEYDIFQLVQKETDATKKVALLNEWKQKYPATEFAKVRAGLYLQAYQTLNQIPNVITAANEIIETDPKDVQTLSALLVLAFQLNNTSPEMLAFVEKTAQSLVANIDNKPAAITDEQWKTQKNQTLGLGYRALGWVAMQRKDTAATVSNLTKTLELNGAQGDVSYWLGQAIISQKDETTYADGLYHVARAAVYDGPGSLPPANRQQVNDYLVKAYKGYHGDDTDLDKLKATAKANPLPPAGFKVLSVREVEERKAEQRAELAKSDPSAALWKGIHERLVAPEGEGYYDQQLKGAGIENLRGWLVEQTPKTLVLAMTSKEAGPEVTLELDAPMVGKADPGTELTFNGVPKAFTKEPFMLTMDAEKASIKGWPAPAAKKPAARKPARTKRRD
jgi:hypothetical protein